MTDRQMAASDELVANYVRAAMRVEPPQSFVAEVMRSAAATTQERRGWLSLFGPYTPAMVAVAAAALVLAIGTLIVGPRNVGPPAPTSEPTATPAPTLTPEDARVLTERGDVIRIAALDSEGEFGTITIRRGEERAGYEGFVPFAFEDVFFVEVYIKYEPTRETSEQYGEWEFAYAADVNGNGFDDEDVLNFGPGFLGMEGQPGYESAPQPQLRGKRSGDEVLEGWFVLQLPASAADIDLYLVYGRNEWTDGVQNLIPDASALLRTAGEPVGVTEFDIEAFPSEDPGATPMPLPSRYALPQPVPSTAPTFEPTPDAEADALFATTATCTNEDAGVAVTYPAAWFTNEAGEDPLGFPLPACAMFSPEEIDPHVLLSGLSNQPFIFLSRQPDWLGGIEPPTVERVPVGDRVAWLITYTDDQMSFGTTYLMELGDDPYGPFLFTVALDDEMRPILERMLSLLEFAE